MKTSEHSENIADWDSRWKFSDTFLLLALLKRPYVYFLFRSFSTNWKSLPYIHDVRSHHLERYLFWTLALWEIDCFPLVRRNFRCTHDETESILDSCLFPLKLVLRLPWELSSILQELSGKFRQLSYIDVVIELKLNSQTHSCLVSCIMSILGNRSRWRLWSRRVLSTSTSEFSCRSHPPLLLYLWYLEQWMISRSDCFPIWSSVSVSFRLGVLLVTAFLSTYKYLL